MRTPRITAWTGLLLAAGMLWQSVTAAPPGGEASYRGQSVSQWAALLADPSKEVRHRAAYALGQIGPQAAAAVPQVIALLHDPILPVRCYAADTLGRIGPGAAGAVPALIEATENPQNDRYVRRDAARALGRIGPPAADAIERLRAALDAEDDVLQVEAALSLWRITGDRAAVAPIVTMLDRPNGEGPYAAATALIEVAGDEFLDARLLVARLDHPSADVRRALVEVLVRIGPPALGPLLVAIKTNDGVRVPAALTAIRLVVARMRRETLDRSETTVAQYARFAGPLAERVVPALIARLADADPDTRHGAIEALATLGLIAAPGLLSSLANDEPTQTGALKALRHLEQTLPADDRPLRGYQTIKRQAIEPLVQVMGLPEGPLRRAAIRLFAMLQIDSGGAAAEPLLRAALADPDAATRRYAAQALARLHAAP